jgi:predicted ATP-grasp superfamily ATP-dependent carboligase
VDQVRWMRKVELRRPVMVVAFEGWNDAGEAASLAVDHLAGLWDAETIATIDPEEFYDFTVARPEISLDENGSRHLRWPDPEVMCATPAGAAHDVLLFRAIEPHMRWRTFTAAVLEVIRTLRIERIVLLGALLADVPHTRPTRVSGTSADPALNARLDLAPSSYEGPTGMVGVLYDALRQSGVNAASLWAAVPHYVHQLPSPKAVLALLDRLAVLLGTQIDPLGLGEAASDYQREVDEQISDDPDIVAYVAELEEAEDAQAKGGGTGPGEPSAAPPNEVVVASAEGLAAEVEKYLRDQRPRG